MPVQVMIILCDKQIYYISDIYFLTAEMKYMINNASQSLFFKKMGFLYVFYPFAVELHLYTHTDSAPLSLLVSPLDCSEPQITAWMLKANSSSGSRRQKRKERREWWKKDVKLKLQLQNKGMKIVTVCSAMLLKEKLGWDHMAIQSLIL